MKRSENKRVLAIIAVVMIEVFMRAAYASVRIDPIVYTLLARVLEMIAILAIAATNCGIQTKNIKKEVLWGLGASVIFGLAAITADLVSRIVLAPGILCEMLPVQHVKNVWIFLITGCILAPLVEEMFFRGLFYAWIRKGLPVWISVIMSAVFFASMHGSVSIIQLVGGLVFAMIYEWRKNIWAAYVVHALANFGIWIIPLAYPLIWSKVMSIWA
ncbi:MAG: type II CAAX endopeptidase family protein [Thermodesulfobacteriota bacterium]|nr:type II CAAX endopeptidase family protein [Thermodesulfobacteriota bacterium]